MHAAAAMRGIVMMACAAVLPIGAIFIGLHSTSIQFPHGHFAAFRSFTFAAAEQTQRWCWMVLPVTDERI